MTDDITKLLARGGRAFGIAAIAHTRGRRAGQGPWHALSGDMTSAADQVLEALEGAVSRTALASAITASMGDAPATAAPAWTSALVESEDAFLRLGRAAKSAWPADFPIAAPRSDRERGIAFTALALCRSIDAARALGGALPKPEGTTLVRWARLMQTLARPGEPSTARARIRRVLSEGDELGLPD